MPSSGQFCAIARTLDIVGGRWTLLIIRELMCGSNRFAEILRGIPRLSRTVLSERLHLLVEMGIVDKENARHGPRYTLTASGRELSGVLSPLAIWGQRWLPRNASDEDIDLDALLADMVRRVREESIPLRPFVLRVELLRQPRRFMLMKKGETSLCSHNPGFPEALRITGPLSAIVAWWRGDATFAEAQRSGLSLEGAREAVKGFSTWFDRYMFADIAPARLAAGGP